MTIKAYVNVKAAKTGLQLAVWSGDQLFLVIGQGPAVLAFFSPIYPVFICLFPFSADTDWPDYNVVDWAVD